MTIFIGVDPAYREGGYWVCEIRGAIVAFYKMKGFIDFVTYVDELAEKTIDVSICIENSNETNHTFISPTVRSPAAREKISRDVGKNQAISQMSVDYCNYMIGQGIYSVSPAEKGMKWSDLITKAEAKNHGLELFNYKGLKSEQDKRDAFKLALRAKFEFFKAKSAEKGQKKP
jgi:hypothetical protein